MRRLGIVLGVGFTAAIVGILWDPFIGAFLHRERDRGEIRTLYESLELGMSRTEVRQVMDSGRYPSLDFHRDSAELWFGETPLQFGARNWMLLIGFEGDQVSTLRVRTADGVDDHPAEAPADRARSVPAGPDTNERPARGVPSFLGVLENPQCKPGTPRSLRVLFEKQAVGWVSLATPKAAAGKLTHHWTVAFDGKSLGTVMTTDPGWHSEYVWTYPRDRLLTVTGRHVPTIPNRGRRFGGWCSPPTTRPLVVVSRPNFSDPARWKPSQPPAALLKPLFPEFRAKAQRVATCPSDPEKPVDLDYSIGDLQLLTGYADGQGRRLVAMSLDPKLNSCDGPTQAAWWPSWYFVTEGGKGLLFIGNGLSIVDAGDYDGDGHSELLFWYSGYDVDGYVLFADEFATRVEYLWNYH